MSRIARFKAAKGRGDQILGDAHRGKHGEGVPRCLNAPRENCRYHDDGFIRAWVEEGLLSRLGSLRALAFAKQSGHDLGRGRLRQFNMTSRGKVGHKQPFFTGRKLGQRIQRPRRGIHTRLVISDVGESQCDGRHEVPSRKSERIMSMSLVQRVRCLNIQRIDHGTNVEAFKDLSFKLHAVSVCYSGF